MDSLISNPLEARAALLDYIRVFPRRERRGGELLHTSGRVTSLRGGPEPDSFVAQVVDDRRYDVDIGYDGYEWLDACTCREGGSCRHAYATALTVLATLKSKPGPATPSDGGSVTGPAGLHQLAEKALGRQLDPEEAAFIRKIRGLHARIRQGGYLSLWDLQDLIPLQAYGGGYGFGPGDLWPTPPSTELALWLYLAHYWRSAGAEIPEFLKPITDFSHIEPELSNWLHSRNVRKWQEALGALDTAPAPEKQSPTGETHLRLMIGTDKAQLYTKGPGDPDFRKARRDEMTSWRGDPRSVSFTLHAQLLWSLFPDDFSSTSIRYADVYKLQKLESVLRAGFLAEHVVNAEGKPLERPAEPLRWALSEPKDGGRDYQLQLVRPDGSPLPPVLCTFDGSPGLILTASALFTAPRLLHKTLDSTRVNSIPADVIESAQGVRFLRSLAVPLPEKLRERVRIVQYQPQIRCSLRKSGTWKPEEECVFKVTAKAEDGKTLSWDFRGWAEKGRGQRMREDQSLTIYDEERLPEVHCLLRSLNLKGSYIDGAPALKINKQFPETFVRWHRSLPQWLKVELAGELASLLDGEVAGRVKLEAQEAEIDWFDLSVVIDVSDTTLTAEEIKLLLRAKGAFVRLEGKGWRRLSFELSPEDDEQLARLGLSPRELSDEPQRLHALQLADRAARKLLPEQQVAQIERRAEEIRTRVTPALPEGITAQLRPYQLEGFHFLAYLSENRFGGILADDMGLGKTLQTLAWLLWLRNNAAAPAASSTATPEPVLVVCPKSVMDNWQAEAVRFAPSVRVKVWSAAELQQLPEQLGTADLHVVNYAQLRSLNGSATSLHWLAVILDEGQYIKNPNSQTAQVARSLRATHRLILSGTPIENRLLDLWSLMGFAMPGVLGNRAQFLRVYDSKEDPLARKRLSSRVRPFLLRRTKSQVATDLPDRVEEDLFCEMEGEQLALYRAELKRAQQLLLSVQTQRELAGQQFNFLTSLLRLRQVCCDPRLVNAESRGSSAKVEALLEQLEPLIEEGQKVLVFSQFVELLDLLRKELDGKRWPLFYLTGASENRGALVRSFQESDGPAVFLISLKAGGFGLNLTAASYVVLFDPWWNPAVENQAIDRTHRIGQVNKVMAYRLLIKNSIEEKIRTLQKQKKALAEDVLGEERFAQSLTLEDLRFLFADG